MADKIKGITIEFNGDTTKLDKALRNIKNETKGVYQSLKDVDRALKFNPKNTELLAQKQKLLKDRVDQTEKSLKDLQDVQKQLDDQGVDKQSEEYMRVRREIIETESKLKHFEAELRKADHIKLTQLGKQLENTGKKLDETGQKVTKNLTLPIVAASGASVKAGMDFDSAMSQVAATMGVTTDEIQDLRDYAIEMGSSTSFSATDAANALNYMALAGYDAKTSMAMLPTVLNLAAAGNMDLAAASDAVTDAQTALGLTTDQTVTLIDEMAQASSKTNTSVEQLSAAILTVGGTARAIKGGTKELTMLLGVLADNGVKGSEGGTALRNILLSLQSPTSKAADALNEMGIKIYDSQGNMRSMVDILADMNKAMGSMTEEQRTKWLTAIFNKRDLKSVNALLNTNAERWDELAVAIDDANGAASKMAATQLDNLKGSLTILKSALEGAAIAISDVLSPAIRKIAEWLTKKVAQFNNLSPKTQKLLVGIALAIAAIGPAMTLVGKSMQMVGKVLQNFSTILNGVTKAFGLLTKAFMAFAAGGPIVWIITAIGLLVIAFVTLWKKSEKFRNFWINLWNDVKKAVSGVATFIKNTFGGMFTAIKSKFTGLGTALGNAISNAVRAGLNRVIARVEFIINSAIALINGGLAIVDKLTPNRKIGRVNKLNLPRLAEGGILRHAQTVIAGEAGPEAIIPLDKLFKKMDEMSTGEITINVYGAAGQSVNELAAEVERRLVAMQKNRRMAWA